MIMSRNSVIILLLVLFSCQSPSGHQPPSNTPTDAKKSITQDDQKMSCDQLLSAIVKSSDAIALKHFSDTLVKVRIDYLSTEKVRIKLFVISNVSEDPAHEKLTENAVGWLELNRQTHRLTDITNDLDKPLVLKYDTTLLQGHDLNKLCGDEAAIAKPGAGYEQRDVMKEADIRFNGRLKRFFTMAEFEKVFGKPDSIQLLKDEAPCVTIFGTEAPDDKYLYKDGSRFETSKGRLAVDEFWFKNGNFITYKGIRIDANTTMNEIKKLFPTAVNGRMNIDKEGKLWVIQLREDTDGTSDGHIKLFFRNGKVSFLHWWFPC